MKSFYWAERVLFRLVSVIIFSLILSSFVFQSCLADEINYLEDPSFEGFQIIQYATYDDGTILLRIRPNIDGNCKGSGLYFRLIRTDGTITQITINNSAFSNFSQNNYCFVNNDVAFTLKPLMASTPTKNIPVWRTGYLFPIDYLVSNNPTDSIRIYGIASNYILISYLCGTSDASVCGLLSDWSGNILSSGINLGDNCNDVNIAQNINSNIGGFLWVCYMNSTSQLIWRRFGTPDATGAMSTIDAGRINDISKFSPNYTSIFPLEDGGYGIVTAQYNTTNYTAQGTSYDPPWTVFVYFIAESGGAKGPFQLYQQTTESLDQLRIFSCSISFQSSGYNCIIYEVIVGATEPAFTIIDFFRTGARKISKIFTISGLSTYQFVVWDILNLFKGGYCVLRQNINNSVIDGLIYDNDGNSNGTWRMPTNYTYTRNIGVYPNNTLWTVANGPNNLTWTLVTSSALANFRTAPDPGGYGNSFISLVSPGNTSIIPLSSTPTLTITFTININLSSGNVSIYQSNGSFPILRQSFRGTDDKHVRLLSGTNGSTQVQFDVLTSTFNQRSSEYFIQVDNAFVEDVQNRQPLLGIRPSVWTVTTTAQESAIIRLTPEGSRYFKNLSDSKRIQFATEMSQDLSSVIPCDIKRIATTSNYQFDDHNQVLLRIDIKNYVKNSTTERIPSKVVEDLDTLIKNRDVTKVSREFSTSMLDPSFGSQTTQDLWDKYKSLLWGLLVLVGILSILVCVSFSRHKRGKHCAIFMFTFLAIDFVLDILFVIFHGQDLYWLYPTREISKNKKFRSWWYRSSKTALLFTILAGADIDVLNILSSECGRLEELSAPFSINAMKRIRQRIIDEHIPDKPDSPGSSGKESEISQEVRHEYLTIKDGVPVVSYPRDEDEISIKRVTSAPVEESITNIEGKYGEIGETLKKTQTLPKRKSDSGMIGSTESPTTSGPRLSTTSTSGTSTKEIFSFIGGEKSKKTMASKEVADKGKGTGSEGRRL
ncbi:1208_t:CDS:10 [Cetraspora pellucida]|uniref:1208_t:CDS:1 n=1 Tax=Cetraspora pellucida TaxID=1433469 RepID=A0A9N8Z1F4_9GLOM|nr:1208_t:CDS:10 [Cetraspora pellucida]